MRLASYLRVATVFALLFAAGDALAASFPVQITAARAGYPDTREPGANVAKFAAWVPLEIDIESSLPNDTRVRLVVETPDADGVQTVFTSPLEQVRPRMLTNIRLAGGSGETTVTVRDADGAALSEPFRLRNLRPRDPLTYVVLGLGSRLPGFDLPRPATGTADAEPGDGPLRGGRVVLCAIEDVERLPTVWFGYDGADLVVLSTSSAEFLTRLQADRARLNALREWVSRGGRLVVSAGVNASLIKPEEFSGLLPARIASTPAVTVVPLYWSARETSQSTSLFGNLAAKGGAFPVAKFGPLPGASPRVVIPPSSRPVELADAVAVQTAVGLGRVTLVGFDLDRAPFVDFPRLAEFWDWVLREGGASRASVGSESKPKAEASGPTDDEDEVAVALRTHADTFEAIPVVSFGSVAFLIVLYILLIGPIEYYFLKRILGRLELTWITFPIIVATVCIAAALSASAMKGNDLRVNKVDVIDIDCGFDPRTGKPAGRVYGSTWFTVFSPKIDMFSPRVVPAEGWTKTRDERDALVGWVGSPRSGRAGLLQRRYSYHTSEGAIADGLDGVPVQVWSTKSFSANWAAEMDPEAPVVESRLVHPVGDPTRAIGTFVNRMPFEALSDCVAFYSGQAYPLGTIVKGQEVRLVLDRGQPAGQWLQERGQLADLLSRGQALGVAASVKSEGPRVAATVPSSHLPLWGMLFHEAALRNEDGVIPRNASLRRLDQSWRLAPDYRNEVVVVGRLVPPNGTIADRFDGNESPTRLLLKGGQSLPGFARQETYVRLFLKVRGERGASAP